jgi:hypothetical protein
MAFGSEVVVRVVSDTEWELSEPLQYTGNTETFVVPAGFRTDFASVPRMFVWLLPSYGRYTRAAILHDFLCDESTAGRFDRDDADGLFRRAMRELNVNFLRRWIMWGAVSLLTHWIHRRGLQRLFTKRFLRLLTIAVLAIPFFLIPAVVVQLWLTLFWVVETAVFLARKPFLRGRVARPRYTWGT